MPIGKTFDLPVKVVSVNFIFFFFKSYCFPNMDVPTRCTDVIYSYKPVLHILLGFCFRKQMQDTSSIESSNVWIFLCVDVIIVRKRIKRVIRNKKGITFNVPTFRSKQFNCCLSKNRKRKHRICFYRLIKQPFTSCRKPQRIAEID